jgi:hypothetical protein
MLASCVQPSAQASADQEKESQMAPQTQAPQGGEAAADAVAAQLDRIAEQSMSHGGQQAPTAESPPAPPGPQLTIEDWRSRVFHLIDGLQTPHDTQPAQVAETLNLTLTDRAGNFEANGSLTTGGTYQVWVNALYRETPDKWTAGLSQEAPTEDCLFPLSALREHLTDKGYNANEGVIRRDGSESALYRSRPTSDGIVFVVSAELVNPMGSEKCIRELRINANTPEEA